MEERFLSGRVIVKTGDITLETTDAIVNAANSTLLGGGGVDGAIHARGGPRILEECRRIRNEDHPEGLPPGEAVITGAGELAARYVIHTVGPVWGRERGRERELLAAAYLNSLRLAVANEVATIAFPSISTGAYSYPKTDAARISSETITDFFNNEDRIERVHLVFFSEADAGIFLEHQKFGVP